MNGPNRRAVHRQGLQWQEAQRQGGESQAGQPRAGELPAGQWQAGQWQAGQPQTLQSEAGRDVSAVAEPFRMRATRPGLHVHIDTLAVHDIAGVGTAGGAAYADALRSALASALAGPGPRRPVIPVPTQRLARSPMRCAPG